MTAVLAAQSSLFITTRGHTGNDVDPVVYGVCHGTCHRVHAGIGSKSCGGGGRGMSLTFPGFRRPRHRMSMALLLLSSSASFFKNLSLLFFSALGLYVSDSYYYSHDC